MQKAAAHSTGKATKGRAIQLQSYLRIVTQQYSFISFYYLSLALEVRFLRHETVTMMTLAEINRAYGVKRSFSAVDARLFFPSLFSSPFPSCTAPIQPLASPPPFHHCVCPPNQSPARSTAAPPLATAARLVALSQVMSGKWAIHRRWRGAERIGTIEAVQNIAGPSFGCEYDVMM